MSSFLLGLLAVWAPTRVIQITKGTQISHPLCLTPRVALVTRERMSRFKKVIPCRPFGLSHLEQVYAGSPHDSVWPDKSQPSYWLAQKVTQLKYKYYFLKVKIILVNSTRNCLLGEKLDALKDIFKISCFEISTYFLKAYSEILLVCKFLLYIWMYRSESWVSDVTK